MSTVPVLLRQKTYIVENASFLKLEIKKEIYRLVMREIGENAVMVNKKTSEISIDLDAIKNPDIILHIYNIVRNRLDNLHRPAQERTHTFSNYSL